MKLEKKAAGLQPRAASKRTTDADHRPAVARCASATPRSPANWFFDAATYARDGDYKNARLAARRGIRALGRMP